jgi:hypothetical protein
LIYLADVISGLCVVSTILFFVFGLASIALFIASCVTYLDANNEYGSSHESIREVRMNLHHFWKGHFSTAIKIEVVVLILAIIVPSKNTVYAIAASEMGERVFKSEQVQGVASDATKALQIWIRKQIDTEKKEESK